MKRCRICGEMKSLEFFHVKASRKDGRRDECKQCRKAESVARYMRPEVSARVKAQSCAWQKENRERTRSHKRQWRQEHPADVTRIQRTYRAENPEKVRAHEAVNYAVRSGKLSPLPCARCGTSERVHAHHDDYSRPLDVIWLCPLHHKERHVQPTTAGRTT